MSRPSLAPDATMPLVLAVTLWAHRKLLLIQPTAFEYRDFGECCIQWTNCLGRNTWSWYIVLLDSHQ